MADIKWVDPGSSVVYLTTQLNTLGSGANKLGGIISNDQASELFTHMAVEIDLAAPSSGRSLGGRVSIYLLHEMDGSNYDFGSDSIDPSPSSWVGHGLPPDDTTAVYMHVHNIIIPPFDFKLLIMNSTGQDFAGTGNTVSYNLYNLESS